MQHKWIYCAAAVMVLLTGCSKSPEERYAQHIEAGRKLLANKDHTRAILEFKNALAIKPTDAETNYQLGMAYMAAGEWKLAAISLQQATDLNAKHVGAQVRYAELLSGSNNPEALEQARKRMREVLSYSPGNVDALTTLGITEWKLSDGAEAERHLREAFLKRPGDMSPAVALARMKILGGKFEEAETLLKEAAQQNPPSALAITVLGEYYLLRQRLDEAQATFESALKVDPKQALALNYLAALLTHRGKLQEAEALVKKVTELPDKRFRAAHAMFLFDTGRKDQGIAELETLSSQNPEDTDLRDKYLGALIATDQVARAEKVLNAVIGKNSSDPHLLLQRAALYVGLQRLDDAEKDLQRVMYLRSNSAQGQLLYAKLYEARGYVLSQRQALNEALRYDPNLLTARLSLARLLTTRGGPKTALQVLNETPETQKNEISVNVERNWAYLAMGNFPEVERALSAELNYPNPEVSILAATMRLAQARPAEARALARKVLDRNAEDIRALEIISRSYLQEKNMEAAVKELAEYAAKRPRSADLQYFMGTVLASYGRRADAQAAFSQALQANPEHIDARLSLIQLDISDGKLDAARQSLQDVAKRSSNLSVALWLGNLNLLKGENQTAIENYRKVLELDPNQVTAMNNLAWLLAEEGKEVDQALGLAQKAAELSPDNPAVQNTLGRIFYQKGLYTMAVRHLERAVAGGSNAKRDFYLGAAYLKSGNQAKGQSRLQAVLKQYPDTWEAKQASQLIAR